MRFSRRWGRHLQRLDRRLYERVTALGPPRLDRLTPEFVAATDNMALWIAISAGIASTGDPRLRRTALRAAIAAFLANGVTTLALKDLFGRRRPDMALLPIARIPFKTYTSDSFPSAHTAAAAAFAGGIVADAPRALSTLVSLLAGAVAFSRVHSGVHYPGDVLGGIAVGAGAAFLARRLLPPRSQPGYRPVSFECHEPDPHAVTLLTW